MTVVLSLASAALTTKQKPILNLKLPRGSWGQVVGPPGSGKTYLLSLISKAMPPAVGTLALFGSRLDKSTPKQRSSLRTRISFVKQGSLPLAHLSVYDNLALPLRLQNLEEKTVTRYCQQLCDWLKYKRPHRMQVSELSFSEARLLTLAQAIIRQPELLLLDDPFASLDGHDRSRMEYLLRELCPAGITLLISRNDTLQDSAETSVVDETVLRLSQSTQTEAFVS